MFTDDIHTYLERNNIESMTRLQDFSITCLIDFSTQNLFSSSKIQIFNVSQSKIKFKTIAIFS